MKDLVLNAQKRNSEEKLSEIRASKMVPAVVYGKNKENISIKIDNSDLIKTYRVAGESHIIKLNVEWTDVEVLVHDVQRHPVTGDFLHIDFYAITRGEKVTTNIQLNFVWKSPATKEGGIIEEVTKELEVKTLPRNLVDSFDVDLSKLKVIWDIIRVSDLEIDSSKYEVLNNWDDVVVLAAEPQKIIIEDEAAEETEVEAEKTAETEEK